MVCKVFLGYDTLKITFVLELSFAICSFHKKNGALPLSEMSTCNGTDVESCHQETAFVSSHHCLPSQHIGFPSPALDEHSDKSHRSAGSCQTLERSHFQTFSSLVQSTTKLLSHLELLPPLLRLTPTSLLPRSAEQKAKASRGES